LLSFDSHNEENKKRNNDNGNNNNDVENTSNAYYNEFKSLWNIPKESIELQQEVLALRYIIYMDVCPTNICNNKKKIPSESSCCKNSVK
jgi:hypothetical protein